MDLESDIQNLQAHLLAAALQVQNLGNSVPELCRYFPSNQRDAEIQLFNITGKLPTRLVGDDDISMWILESEHINRSRVCRYLGTASDPTNITNGIRYRREDVPKAVLKRLASKICCLDVGKGFVEGMKLFIPVVGCWDLYASRVYMSDDLAVLHRILTEYVIAHIKHSDRPLFPSTPLTDSNISTIVEIAMCVLSLSKVLHEGTKSSSTAMADFFASLRAVLRDQPSPSASPTPGESISYAQLMQATTEGTSVPGALSLSMKAMTELFTATSTGLPLVSLSQSHRNAAQHVQSNHHPVSAVGSLRPSYLFTEDILNGAASFSVDLETPLQSTFVRLTHDALYFSNAESELPEGCIPLEAVHVRTQDAARASRGELLTLTGISGSAVPFVHFNYRAQAATVLLSTATNAPNNHVLYSTGVNQIPFASGADKNKTLVPSYAPSSVTYHPYVLLNVAASIEDPSVNSCDVWIDAVESAAWECRASQSRHVST